VAGFQFIFTTDGAPDLATLVPLYESLAAGIFVLEGANEPDNFPPGKPLGFPGAVAFQQALYGAVKASPALAHIPVLHYCDPPNAASCAHGAYDWANVHLYYPNPATGQAEIATKVRDTLNTITRPALLGDVPVWATEYGDPNATRVGWIQDAMTAAGYAGAVYYDLTDMPWAAFDKGVLTPSGTVVKAFA